MVSPSNTAAPVFGALWSVVLTGAFGEYAEGEAFGATLSAFVRTRTRELSAIRDSLVSDLAFDAAVADMFLSDAPWRSPDATPMVRSLEDVRLNLFLMLGARTESLSLAQLRLASLKHVYVDLFEAALAAQYVATLVHREVQPRGLVRFMWTADATLEHGIPFSARTDGALIAAVLAESRNEPRPAWPEPSAAKWRAVWLSQLDDIALAGGW